MTDQKSHPAKSLDQPGSGTYENSKSLDQPGSGIDSVRQIKSK